LIEALTSSAISEATLLNYVLSLYYGLQQWEIASIEQLMGRLVVNVDETSLRVDKRNHWIHSYSAGDITLKFLHEKRRRRRRDQPAGRRTLAKARSLAMKCSRIGTMSFTGSITAPPSASRRP
jgi:hypothetical protein